MKENYYNGIMTNNEVDDIIHEEQEEREIVGLSIIDIIEIATGADKDGKPLSLANFSIEEIVDEEKTKRIKSIDIEKGVFKFFIDGGCAVMEIDFPPQGMYEYKALMKLCKDWFNNEDSEKDRYVTGLVVPRLLEGQIVLLFQDLVYFTGIVTDSAQRLIIVFDNNESNVIENENVDYENIKKVVEEELKKEEDELEKEYMEVKKQIEEIENYNPYEEALFNNMKANLSDMEENIEDIEEIENTRRKTGVKDSSNNKDE